MNKRHFLKLLHFFLKILGIVLVLAGILGLFFPVIPGTPLLVIGILILGEESWISKNILKLFPRKIREVLQKGIRKVRGKANGASKSKT